MDARGDGHARRGWNTKFELRSKEVREILTARSNFFPRRRISEILLLKIFIACLGKKKKLDRLDYSVIIERVLSYDKTSIR